MIRNVDRFIWVGILLIVSGLFLNQWMLKPFLHIYNGQISILRIIIIWIFDIFAIGGGIVLLAKKKDPFRSPKKIIFTASMILLLLMFSEFLLQMLVCISPKIDHLLSNQVVPPSIPDQKLKHRPNPELPDHDSNGFRNVTALTKADIAAIGDSQTYGTNVKRHQAWPFQLGAISNASVYNISCGGYGSVEGLILMQNIALGMNPDHIIFMMYDGNDLFDAFNAVYDDHLYDKLISTDSLTRSTIAALEQEDPLKAKIKETTYQLWAKKPASPNTEPESSNPKKGLFFHIKQLKVFQLFFSLERTLQTTFFNRKEFNWTRIKSNDNLNSDLFEIVELNDFKTIFTPSYRRVAMDIEDPRIEEGLRITLEAIREMKQLGDSHQIHFFVLLLPTKEKVFCDLYSQCGINPSESLQTTVKLNDKIRSRTIEYLQRNEIEYIDTMPILQACFEQNKQPYFIDADGHLNPIGHYAIAKAVSEYIESRR